MRETHADITRRTALGQFGCGAAAMSALALWPSSASAAPQGSTPAATAANGADAALDRIAYAMLAHEPGRATGLGVDTGEYAAWRGTFGKPGEAGENDYAATLKQLLAEVRSYPREGLTPDQVVGFDVVESAFAKALEGMALPYGSVAVGGWRNAPYNVVQNVGGYIDYPRFFSSTQPLRSADDVVHYVSRVSEIPKILAAETDRLKFNRGLGLVPPDFLLAKTIAQMEASIAQAEDSYAGPLAASPYGGNEAALRAVRTIIAEGIQPMLAAQLDEIRTQAAIATSKAGMWAQPDGDEYYAWAVSASTTTSLTPDEIHEQGRAELAELHSQMDVILKELGYSQGSVGARMRALSDDPAYKFAPGDDGRKQIVAFIEDRIGWIKAQMPRAFSQLVDPPLEVRRLPLAEEPGAPGAYGGAGAKDGSIPGRMWINLRTTDLHRKYDLADLTFHESIPGHVWEGEFSNRLPLIRSILAFNAFSEGWALYGEQLADELGAYDDFKVGRLGYLQSLAFRACRLVVDTGLHHKRWTREEARRFFVEENGSKVDEVASEVDRYCSWPGQACGYKIGHTEILRQRARAHAELGGRYDFKAFNTAVVLGGNAPLDVMAKTVSRYIASAKG